MPAYRSADEKAIRDDVVAWLRENRPASRIIHEINVCQGGNRIDVLAVGESEIIAVEIKSARDKMDRAPDQIAAMRGVAHHVYLAAHQCHMEAEIIGNPDVADGIIASAPIILRAPQCVRRDALFLAWPRPSEDARTGMGDVRPWSRITPSTPLQTPLPPDAIHMLWRDELALICERHRISVNARSTMTTMLRDIRWLLNGREITQAICRALRERAPCAEADPPIFVGAGAPGDGARISRTGDRQ